MMYDTNLGVVLGTLTVFEQRQNRGKKMFFCVQKRSIYVSKIIILNTGKRWFKTFIWSSMR